MTDLADIEVTDAGLAGLVGCSPRYIRRLAQDGKITRVGRNTFKLGDAIRGVLDQLSGGSDRLGKQLMEERIRKVRADATRAELELAKAAGEVAPVAEFEHAQVRFAATVQANLLNVPARAVLRIIGETSETEIKGVLRAEIVTALKQAAEVDPADLEEIDDEPEENSE